MKINPEFWAFDDPVDDEPAATFDTEPEEKDEEPASVIFNAIRDRYDPIVDETGEDS